MQLLCTDLSTSFFSILLNYYYRVLFECHEDQCFRIENMVPLELSEMLT